MKNIKSADSKPSSQQKTLSIMLKKLFLLAPFVIMAIAAEASPYGVVMRWGMPDGVARITTCSYFSLLPFGYAHFTPLLTAVLSCISMVLIAAYIISGKAGKAALITCGAAAVLSIIPIFMGTYNAVTMIVAALLFFQTMLVALNIRKNKIRS